MYDLINHFAQTVVDTIPPEHVTDYEWLLQNVGQASTLDYPMEHVLGDVTEPINRRH